MRLYLGDGLTCVDPKAYDGWPGDCPGCDLDVQRSAALCHRAAFDGTTVLVNQAATIEAVRTQYELAAAKLQRDDLLVLFHSGHGGQQPSIDGDEADGKDETLCLYDGELVDNQIAEHLAILPAGVRVLFVTDSCNSGTNYRGLRRVARSTPVQLNVRAVSKFRGSLLHFGGCADGRSSYGDEAGGDFTNALLRAWSRARKPLTYRQWFAKAAALMPRRQIPVIAEWGGPSFADRTALT